VSGVEARAQRRSQVPQQGWLPDALCTGPIAERGIDNTVRSRIAGEFTEIGLYGWRVVAIIGAVPRWAVPRTRARPGATAHLLERIMLTMPDIAARLGDVKEKTTAALQASTADDGASAVLVAVVREFDSKTDKAMRNAGTDESARDSVIELEQAGDSAKAAAEADPGLGEDARESVLAAHLAICILKTEV
jgi:hypothetical protein